MARNSPTSFMRSLSISKRSPEAIPALSCHWNFVNQIGQVAKAKAKKFTPVDAASTQRSSTEAARGFSMESREAKIETVNGTIGSPNRMNRYSGVYSRVWVG